MASYDFDLFIIGGGSGGVRAARMAAQRGARVALAEAGALGGTCVNVGCIPKKLYSYAGHFAQDAHDAAGFGWDLAAPVLDWARLKANRAKEVARLNGIYQQLVTGAGAQLLRGWARLLDGHTVELRADDGTRRYTAAQVLIATGGRPHVPELPGRELVITSNEIFDLEPFPRRLVVVGGGYIACEFASIFKGLGAEVTQLYRGEQVLRGFDDDVRAFVAGELRKAGIDQRLHAEVARVARDAQGLVVTLHDGSRLAADAVLYATGRVPLVDGLGLQAAGVAQDAQGAIQVDAQYRSSAPSVSAVGDVTGHVQLTPVALAQAMVVVDRLFGHGTRQLDYEYIPTAVFTQPHIGTVGYTEAQAREKFGALRIFRTDFRPLKHTLSGSSERTFMKLVVQAETDRVVGLHMVGPEAGEVVQGFAVAMRAGATKALFDSTVGIHPTAAEEFVTMREPVAG